MAYTVKAVATLAGVSVRTLHHYDRIGLLRPATSNAAGYRQYTQSDLERLQQILFFRELDFSLAEIQVIVDSPDFDRQQALTSHRQLLIAKQQRLQTLIRSVDLTLASLAGGTTMDTTALFDGFDDARMAAYRDEARARWGSAAVDESVRRTSTYGKADWADIQAAMGTIEQAIAANMDGEPGAPAVQAQVDAWFRLINDRFYTCTPEVFRGLGDLYVSDSRFTAHYDKVKPGLAGFLRQAMHTYCDRLSVHE